MKVELVGGSERREIVIADYDPAWPEKYEVHRGVIARALDTAALRIEHIGSTSVPGLAAKPIIDILVVVKDSANEPSYCPQLEAAGYVMRVREPDWNEHRMFGTLEKDAHVHVYTAGCAEIERVVIFRDRLRAHAGDRQRYEDTKRALARIDWPDINAYANAKSEVIESIMAAARDSGMIGSREVVLEPVAPRDAAVLSNLLELYAHDLSEVFALELGANGRFGYEKLPLYWSEPERRFPFFIRARSQLAGFALVTRGSPASDDPNDFDVAEFFVLRRHRRSGVGRQAAFLLWNRFAVRWIVRVSEGNHEGLRFWASVIAEYTSGRAVESTVSGSPHAWRVFSFDSARRRVCS
jgi:GrpB-like predicted nucleotidyltransferase (UPF0157 family)/predicted acetyltransferase